LGFSEVGDDSIDEVSGDVKGVEILAGPPAEFPGSLPELIDRRLVEGKMSGALYESIFVVESNSTGADILCRIVPEGYACLVVRLLCGTEPAPASAWALLLLVVKALEREDMVAVCGRPLGDPIRAREGRKRVSPSTDGSRRTAGYPKVQLRPSADESLARELRGQLLVFR